MKKQQSFLNKINICNITIMYQFWIVMVFYAILSCVVFPYVGYQLKGKSGLGQGYVVGTALSLLLWFTVGKKYVGL